MSKAPVREALVQLCSEKMLKSIPRCGYQVVQITAREIEGRLEHAVASRAGCFGKNSKKDYCCAIERITSEY